MTDRTFKLTTLSTVEPRPITWLLPGRIPYGALTILSGDPGTGKSQVSIKIASDLSKGGSDVILVGAEDALDNTVRPRVVAAGGTLERVHAFSPWETAEDITSLPEDVPLIERAVKSLGASLVVVDPLTAHLSEKLDAHSDHSVRRATGPLALMARTTGCAVLLVSHLRKQREGTPLYRVGGSIGITGNARSVLLFGKPKRDKKKPVDTTFAGWDADERWLCHTKCNGARLAPAMRCVVQDASIHDAGMDIDTSRVLFDREDPEFYPEDLE